MSNEINGILCMLTQSLDICISGFSEAYNHSQLFMPLEK